MQRYRITGRRLRNAIWLALGAFTCVAALSSLGRLYSTESGLLGIRFNVRGSIPTTDEVLLIALTQPVPNVSGPAIWPTQQLAELVERLDEAGATVIGLDIPGITSSYAHKPIDWAGLRLADAMRAHGKVVMPLSGAKEGDQTLVRADEIAAFSCGHGAIIGFETPDPVTLALPPAELVEAAAGVGSNRVFVDVAGVVREAPLAVSWRGTIYPAFWTELVRLADGLPPGSLRITDDFARLGERSWRINQAAEVLINYRGDYNEFPRVSYHATAAMPNDQLEGLVKGKIVIVGTDRADATSYLRTPTASRMPGAEVAAHVTDNLLAGDPLSRTTPWAGHASAILLALLTAWLVSRAGPLSGLFITAFLVAGVFMVGIGLFLVNIYVPMAEALLAVGLTGALLVANSAASVDSQRVAAETRLHSRLQTIAGIGRLTNSSLDRDQLLIETLRWAEGEIGTEAASLLLMDPSRQFLRFEVALGDKGPMLKDFRIELGKGIAGTVALTGEPVVVDDVRRDPRWAVDIADAIEFQTRSILAVPMTLQNQVVGVLELINKREGTFTDQDVQLLTVIAHQAALFLETARLYRELSDRVDFANDELRNANRRLAIEMARISTLVAQMVDGVVATDASDRIVIFNDVAQEMLGIDEDEALGNPILAVIDNPILVELFAMPLSPHGGSYETEIVLDKETGRTVQAHIALIEREGEQAADKCAIFTDITHLKKLDQMKTDLISFVSHELKNPIASLQGACHMLTDRVKAEDETTEKLLEIARRQARRMQYLVQDFLDLSRVEAGMRLELTWMEIADARELIEGVFELCRHGGSEHHRSMEVDEGLGAFWVDRPKIESVLINLVENAQKYSPEGGDVIVRAYGADGHVVIEVEDQGEGIKPEDLPRLFQSFQRVHDDSYGRVSGTGVGLYVCRHIVQAHGGEITVESVWQEGSTFTVRIPHYTALPGEEGGPPARGE